MSGRGALGKHWRRWSMKNRSGTQVRQNASKRGMSDGAKALSMWSNYGLIKFQIPATCGRSRSTFLALGFSNPEANRAMRARSRNMELDEFVHQQNLALYRRLLAESPTDDSKRMMLAKLLAEEEAKLTTRGKIRRSK